MSKWKIYTPTGVQDILFEDCFVKRNIESDIRKLFTSCGYFEIETPTLEFFDTFSADADLKPQETMFKFFDQEGRILVLRPDMTIPVARIAATKLKDMEYPIKVSYIGNTFVYNELGGGKQKEFTQAGVELLGAGRPEADAEVIALAIKALKAAGLENFQIDIGQVEFFKGLMEETGLSSEETEKMRVLIDSKDFLGIEELVNKHDIRPDLKELILSLPGLFGSTDVLDKAMSVTVNERSQNALNNLRQVLEILHDYDFDKYVSVDLGMIQSIDYYTGIIFKGFTYGAGFPVLRGGRYDSLTQLFGRNCPATGFSIGINMVMMALERQKITSASISTDSLICYEEKGRKAAFMISTALREQGLCVETDTTLESLESLKDYASKRGIGGIIRVIDPENIELHNLKTGSIEKTGITSLINNGFGR